MNQALDIEIDILSESVVEVLTGKIFKTHVSKASIEFLNKIHKKNGWKFNWKKEAKDPNKLVYKMVLDSNKSILLGLISFEIKQDHVHIHLIENSPENVGKIKVYQGIAGNLFAFACKFSLESGFDGVVSFIAKTNLIQHYFKLVWQYTIFFPEVYEPFIILEVNFQFLFQVTQLVKL